MNIILEITIGLFFLYVLYNIAQSMTHTKRERTLKDVDVMSLGQVDGEQFENYQFQNVDQKPVCLNCHSDNLVEVYPKKEIDSKILHVCFDCQERCYI